MSGKRKDLDTKEIRHDSHHRDHSHGDKHGYEGGHHRKELAL